MHPEPAGFWLLASPSGKRVLGGDPEGEARQESSLRSPCPRWSCGLPGCAEQRVVAWQRQQPRQVGGQCREG